MVLRGFAGRDSSVGELNIAFLLVDLEHAVYQAHQLLVHHSENNALLLDRESLEPLLRILDRLLVHWL